MRIAIKYGLLITLGIIAWVVIAHMIVPNPCSSLHKIGPLLFFNVLEIVGICFGIRESKRGNGQLQFKAALKTGVRIAFVYGVASCVFFLVFLSVLGRGAMCPDPRTASLSSWQVAGLGFAAQFLGAVFLGLIYSTVISFILVRRRA